MLHDRLAARYGANNEEGLGTIRHLVRQQRIGRLVRKIFRTTEESDERPALLSAVIPDCATKRRVRGLERV